MFIAFSKTDEDNELDCSVRALDQALGIFVQLVSGSVNPTSTAPRGSTNKTLHRLLYGLDLQRPGNLLQQVFDQQNFASGYDAEVSQSIANMVMKHYYDRRHTPKSLSVGDKAYLRVTIRLLREKNNIGDLG